MDEDKKLNKSIDDKLFMIRYKVAMDPHLAIKDQEACRKCGCKDCLIICPANVYKTTDDVITVAYEGCVECGACRIVCPDNIEWKYPKGGHGVQYRLA